jgi:hypothetical protein
VEYQSAIAELRNVNSECSESKFSPFPAGQLFGLLLSALRGISDFIVIDIYLSAIEVSINSKFFDWIDTSSKKEKKERIQEQ